MQHSDAIKRRGAMGAHTVSSAMARPLAACALLALACLIIPQRASAEDDLERERLAQIVSELAHLQQLVHEAQLSAQQSAQTSAPSADQSPAGPDAHERRIQFHYDWLEQDLQQVRQGIEDHLSAPRQPRPAPPLRTDYRTSGS